MVEILESCYCHVSQLGGEVLHSVLPDLVDVADGHSREGDEGDVVVHGLHGGDGHLVLVLHVHELHLPHHTHRRCRVHQQPNQSVNYSFYVKIA